MNVPSCLGIAGTESEAGLANQSPKTQPWACLRLSLFPFNRREPTITLDSSTYNNNHLFNNPSESPFTGSLNVTTPLSRTSLSTFPVTISPFDITSFTTDNQQSTWLPQPPSSRPPAIQNSLPSDFVLYPPASTLQVRDWNQRSTHPNSIARRSSQYNSAITQNQRRRHSYQQQPQQQQQAIFGAQVQDPRVINVISQSNRFPTSSNRSYSTGTNALPRSRFYAASAPSNSPQPTRPPVPLFSESENISQYTQQQNQQQNQEHQPQAKQNMSTSSLPQDFGELLDFSVENLDSASGEILLDESLLKYSNFASVNDSTQVCNGGTISPSDLMMDASAPPSTSFTDMSTPSFESPGYFSHDTSPLFTTDPDLGPGHEEWESLFPVESTMPSMKADNPKLNATVRKTGPVASPMARTISSPGQSPRVGRPSTRHSSVSGIKRNRDKPLPPIQYDTADPVAAKRARNTEAARKSRARKVEAQDHMERRIAELEKSLEEARQREEYWKSIAESKE